ncbi:HD-GYP domain, c-di-GMP phosphodiesterase class II (or its inactivated variant) [Marinitoga hydrogenitolerans DSM 16785]|uniref:HD-GYP domain, c-di-GMP phosphodiesterase class II (Or its inactivated variant) n=1 Tax=Marinitoga hydrogenitolerans (strain DSM 16785 / JCM 12826 / AT1271) TaxID=1122195 RepID=A0A1M4Y5T1_MARH1|nr:HD-GYP domain-containing protein [Marinitoga hydrogenitolerans]SHF01177.1 HD-GYP domain, c-di-GMP phosphodiesterase class II (or its inactivated variant) [Marinitoga hydrogenitolerans DSM 16785]
MKFLSLTKVKPGMILAMDIKNFEDKILFKKGTVLDNNKIKIIKENGIFRIPVNIPEKEQHIQISIKEAAHAHSFISEELLEKSFNMVKNLFNDLMDTGIVDVDEATNIASNLTKEMQKNFSDKLYVPLKKLKNYDEYLYSHSLNVMILGALIGLEEGISDDELIELALSGLLHDIGKTKIPLEILNAPRKLSSQEFELVKNHVLYAKEILETSKISDKKVIEGALEHHERYDGTGYIFKKKGNDISYYGRILAISDVYDALTSTRCYKEPWTPYKTLSYILSHVNKHFDPQLTQNLVNALGLFPPGMEVILSDGSKGIIIATNRSNKMKPIIKINDNIVDLTEEKTLRIIKIVDYKYFEDEVT